jgi:hypothetical protein
MEYNQSTFKSTESRRDLIFGTKGVNSNSNESLIVQTAAEGTLPRIVGVDVSSFEENRDTLLNSRIVNSPAV